MGIAIADEHAELATVVRSFLEARGARAAARAALDAEAEVLPPFWKEFADLGWLGIHVPEAHGGQGFGPAEAAVVLEQLGRAAAPGPFLPTMLAAAVVAASGSPSQQAELLPGLATGATVGAVGFGDGPVVGGGLADVLVLRRGNDMVVVRTLSAGVTVVPRPSLDLGRRVADVEVADDAAVDVLPGAAAVARTLARALAAAEAAGGAQACIDMAVSYAKERVQFDRPIGSFQAVKHRCADMFVAGEAAAAVAWDACRADPASEEGAAAAAAAASVALPAFLRCAEANIQVHGGIGFTWEHDAHVFLRRAGAAPALAGRPEEAAAELVDFAARGVARRFAVDLPPEAEALRLEVRGFLAAYDALPEEARRQALVDSGYLVPHWPRPWGRGAGPVEQLVIDEEFGDRARPELGIAGWIALTLAQQGTPEQSERWVRPILEGTTRWCQLFSEPDAGSDAAAISTRAVRTEGGWRLTGQKVWTSGAHAADFGLATVRTNPDAPKHRGITMVVLNMRAPGVEVRPLREITGEALFNEVFLQDVFVPDDHVVGEVDGGWRVARATLGNERVSIGGGFRDQLGSAEELVPLTASAPGFQRSVGALLAEGVVLRLLGLRQAARAVAGGGPGPEGNVTKLLKAEHGQHVADLGMAMLGAGGAAADGPGGRFVHLFVFNRCLTIAGGTSEIVRNQIGEVLLGLPRG